jgi:quinoprotein glucose dehydrogenase
VGKRLDRVLLLESVVNPNAKVAPGYGMTSVTRKDGSTLTGVQKEDRADAVVIVLPDGKVETIARTDIQSQIPPASVMPPMGAILPAAELRDLVEYLATGK